MNLGMHKKYVYRFRSVFQLFICLLRLVFPVISLFSCCDAFFPFLALQAENSKVQLALQARKLAFFRRVEKIVFPFFSFIDRF